jgi:hypothetical protein
MFGFLTALDRRGQPPRLEAAASPGLGRIFRVAVFGSHSPLGPPRPAGLPRRAPPPCPSSFESSDSSSCRRSVTLVLIAASTWLLRSCSLAIVIVLSGAIFVSFRARHPRCRINYLFCHTQGSKKHPVSTGEEYVDIGEQPNLAFVPRATALKNTNFKKKTTQRRSAERTDEVTHIKNFEILGRGRV